MKLLEKLKSENHIVLVQAPLAGVTNLAFRVIVKEAGADAVVSEMVSINGLIHDNKRTKGMLKFIEEERPFGVQLFGGDIENVEKAMEFVVAVKPDFIDLNCGCPVKKIIKQGSGSSLLKTPEKIYKILSIMKKSSNNIPVSAKIRSGWDSNSINYLEVGKAVEESGADFIAFHARTRAQLYDGEANWDIIADLKESLDIPLIGNGDIKSIDDYIDKAQSRGITNVMIGRGAYENPYIYQEIKTFVEAGKRVEDWDINMRIDMIFKHIDYLKKYNPEINIVPFMKKHVAWYLKGVPGIKVMRREIFAVNSYEEMSKLLNDFRN